MSRKQRRQAAHHNAAAVAEQRKAERDDSHISEKQDATTRPTALDVLIAQRDVISRDLEANMERNVAEQANEDASTSTGTAPNSQTATAPTATPTAPTARMPTTQTPRSDTPTTATLTPASALATRTPAPAAKAAAKASPIAPAATTVAPIGTRPAATSQPAPAHTPGEAFAWRRPAVLRDPALGEAVQAGQSEPVHNYTARTAEAPAPAAPWLPHVVPASTCTPVRGWAIPTAAALVPVVAPTRTANAPSAVPAAKPAPTTTTTIATPVDQEAARPQPPPTKATATAGPAQKPAATVAAPAPASTTGRRRGIVLKDPNTGQELRLVDLAGGGTAGGQTAATTNNTTTIAAGAARPPPPSSAPLNPSPAGPAVRPGQPPPASSAPATARPAPTTTGAPAPSAAAQPFTPTAWPSYHAYYTPSYIPTYYPYTAGLAAAEAQQAAQEQMETVIAQAAARLRSLREPGSFDSPVGYGGYPYAAVYLPSTLGYLGQYGSASLAYPPPYNSSAYWERMRATMPPAPSAAAVAHAPVYAGSDQESEISDHARIEPSDETQWVYLTPYGNREGPFSTRQMADWTREGRFTNQPHLPLRRITRDWITKYMSLSVWLRLGDGMSPFDRELVGLSPFADDDEHEGEAASIVSDINIDDNMHTREDAVMARDRLISPMDSDGDEDASERAVSPMSGPLSWEARRSPSPLVPRLPFIPPRLVSPVSYDNLRAFLRDTEYAFPPRRARSPPSYEAAMIDPPSPRAPTTTTTTTSVGKPRGAGAGVMGVVERPECTVCMDARMSHVVLPCKHAGMCGPCAMRLYMARDSCPYCRGPIKTLLDLDSIIYP